MIIFINFLFPENYGVCYGLASAHAIYFSYHGNKKFVFNNKYIHKIKFQFMKFILLHLFTMLLASTTMYILCDVNKINYDLGFIISLIVQLTIGFYFNKNYIFNN